MPAELVDVAVVGAGPAGSAAAIAALRTRPGARVVLLDAARFPRDKACGDGIAPHAFDVLAGLGTPDVTADSSADLTADLTAGYPPVHLLALQSPLGATLQRRVARPNYVIPRRVFDARLVEAAQARGAELRRCRVRAVQPGADAVALDVGSGAALRARVVVAADGAHSTVRRCVAGRQPRRHTALAVRGYAPAPAGEPAQLIRMVRDGWPAYAWSFPVGDGSANVGFGMLLPRLRGGRAELWGRLQALLPHQPADPGSLRAHPLPFASARPAQPDGRVLLAGDAASLVNPMTGEGIFYAVASGALAGAAAVADQPAAGGPGGAYRRALHAELGRHLRHTAVVARAARSPRVVDAAFRAAGGSQDVFDRLVELGLGAGTLDRRTLARVGLAAVLPGRVGRPGPPEGAELTPGRRAR